MIRSDHKVHIVTEDHRARCTGCDFRSPDYASEYPDLDAAALDRLAAAWAAGHKAGQVFRHEVFVDNPITGAREPLLLRLAVVYAESPDAAARAYWGADVAVDSGRHIGDRTYSTGSDYRVFRGGRQIGWVETR